jgi:hypothetical protein
VTPTFGTQLPQQWLAARGGRPLQPNDIKIRLRHLGDAAVPSMAVNSVT